MIEEATDLVELAAFFRRAWPDEPDAGRVETIQWRYRNGVNLVWRSEGSIVGHLGILPVTVDVGGRAIDAAWFFDWHVLESHRGRAAGVRILEEATSRYPLALAVGLTETTVNIISRIGWKDGGIVNRHQLPLDPAPFLLKRLGRAARFPGLIPAVRSFVHLPICDIPESITHSKVLQGRIEDTPSDFAHVRRDEAYVASRFQSEPPWPHHFLHDDRGGVSVWSIKDRNDGIRVGMLLEHHASDDRAMLAAGLRVLRDEGVHLVTVYEKNMPFASALRKLGFMRRPGLRFMWRWNVKDEPAPFSAPDAWQLCGSDSDMDR